jgi:hypothetical protein
VYSSTMRLSTFSALRRDPEHDSPFKSAALLAPSVVFWTIVYLFNHHFPLLFLFSLSSTVLLFAFPFLYFPLSSPRGEWRLGGDICHPGVICLKQLHLTRSRNTGFAVTRRKQGVCSIFSMCQ